MTFRNPAVLEALAEFELVKIDIDAQEARGLCGRYHGGDVVPAGLDSSVHVDGWSPRQLACPNPLMGHLLPSG